MYAKIEITGKIEVVTGMHIGGSSAFAAIGAIDSPIVKDARTNVPMIPGSSLKGKLRTLLARKYNDKVVSCQEDDDRIKRLFGSSNDKKAIRSRLIFADTMMSNADEIRAQGLNLTEVKFENTINRATGVANPRQIERAYRGTEFELSIIYEAMVEDEIAEDIQMLCEAMKLLEYDYLGGNGSRGYGKVKFNELEEMVVVGEIKDEILDKCDMALKEV